ncbi:MAG: alpha/beta hydrolase [Mailhella sp.]|nr:alpha/beta hydrolase [Mailhella sp.]
MPIVLSYRWRRDPEYLVEKAGLGSRVQSWSEEKRFLDALDAMPASELGDLCIVMGGFMDGMLGRAYRILPELPSALGTGFDIYYREHDDRESARRLLRRYGTLGRRIVLIGHSWGGSSLVLDVLGHKSCRDIPVTALITLDPVAVRPPRYLPQVRRWMNIYLPYAKARWSRENNVARLGRPWQYLKQADINYTPTLLRHSRALDMYKEFGETFLQLVMMDGAGESD